MTYSLSNNCTKNYYNRTLTVQVTVEDVVTWIFFETQCSFVKQGAHLTKPGWSKPHTHSNPTNLALFSHKITLYRFNQGGGVKNRLMLLQGGLKWEQGAELPSL